MGILKWYKRDPRAALAGMMELSLEERGAYNTILDLIYAHDGELLDDAKLIAAWLGADVRVWKRIRERLLGCGKLYIHAGHLRNQRADDEVHRALHRVTSATENANKRWSAYNEIKGLRDAVAMLPTPTTRKLSFLVPGAKKKEDFR